MSAVKSVLSALAGAACLMAGGCATIVNGFDQDITVRTDPPGAQVSLSDGQSCTSPCTLSVPRGGPQLTAELVRPGCRPARETLYSLPPPGDSGWFGPAMLYSALDYELGGAYRLSPDPLDVTLFCDKP